MKNEGYLLCAFGKEPYYQITKRLIENIKKFDKKRKICVLTDNPALFNKNDNVIIKNFKYKDHLHSSMNKKNNWDIYGLIPKIYQHLYTPFDVTMFFDVDMIFYKDFTFLWKEFRKNKKINNSPILVGGKCDDNNRSPSNWHWAKIDNIIVKCGFNCPQIWSTFIIYDSDFKKIAHDSGLINEIFNNLKKWDVKSSYNGGYPDEIIYSLIMGKLNIKPNLTLHDWFLDISNVDSCNKTI